VRQANDVIPAGSWDQMAAIDSVELDSQDRHRRRLMLVGSSGDTYLLNLAEPVQLRDGDGLKLDDGAMLRVAGKPEQLVEIEVADAHHLAQLAWHLGNRHTEMQMLGERLRIRRDHVLEDMLAKLGARLTPVEAPFDPESGAYGHHHAHSHDDDESGHG
jgi:urease accessory protein